jgi:hypothetical protein
MNMSRSSRFNGRDHTGLELQGGAQTMGSMPLQECWQTLIGWAEGGLLTSDEVISAQPGSFGTLRFIFDFFHFQYLSLNPWN